MDCNMNNCGTRSNMNSGMNNHMNYRSRMDMEMNMNHSRMNSNMREPSRMNYDMHEHSRMNMQERSKCKDNEGDDCAIMKDHIDHMCPGMAYVPWQKWECIYDMEKGFERGTIFEQLDKPYLGRAVK